MAHTSLKPLETELETFRSLLPSLLDRTGQFAVVFGRYLVGTFTSWEDACKAGYERAGLRDPFLVKKIERSETVNYLSRPLNFACPT